MFDASLSKSVGVVLGIVKPYHFGHVEVLKNVDVAAAAVAIRPLLASLSVNRTHECDELAGDDPVQVPVLHLLVVLILFDVEFVKHIPALLDCELKAFKAVFNCTFVVALALAGVSVGTQEGVVGTERLPGLACGLAEDHNHIGSHQESAVGKFDVVVGGLGVVVNFDEAFELGFL